MLSSIPTPETVVELGMETIDILDSSQCDCLIEWLKGLDWQQETYNSRPTKRKIKWFGLASTGYQTQVETKIWRDELIPSQPLLKGLQERFYPEADSALLYHYAPGTAIGDHTDKGFEPEVVVINLLDVST